MLSLDVVGTYERDAVNISAMYPAQAVNANGTPTTFPSGFFAGCKVCRGLKATLSNQTTSRRQAKYSFGSWGPEQPIVAKAPLRRRRFSRSRCMPVTSGFSSRTRAIRRPLVHDDGFTFNIPAASIWLVASANRPRSITSVNFGSACGPVPVATNEIFQIFWVGAKYGLTRDLDIIAANYLEYWQNTYR